MKLCTITNNGIKWLFRSHYKVKLVYLNGNNAAEGENNFKYANSHPMNLTLKNWIDLLKIFESLW